MIRVFTIEAIESMSGEHAPVDKPDPKGTRRVMLRVTVDDHMREPFMRMKVEVFGVGPVENVPSTDAT